MIIAGTVKYDLIYEGNMLAKVLNILRESTSGAEIKGEDCLFLPDKDLSVRLSIERAEEDENGAIVVIYFWLSHPSFDEPLFETAAAIGDGLDRALENALKSFYAGIYTAVIEYLEGDSDATYTTDFFGEEKLWDMVESDLVLMGQADKDCRQSYWNMIQETLANHIGNRPLYYIKVFVSKQDEENIICECRVNDIASQDLSTALYEYVKSWKTEGFHSQKQFFFLSQRTPYTPYPYTKKQIEALTVAAVNIFENCTTDEDHKQLTETIAELTGDDVNLAVELRNFMPEMCAEYHFEEFRYAEAITLYRENKEDREVYKDRFTPYYWIRNRLIDGFANKEFSMETYKHMISMSAIFNVYMQVKEKGKDLQGDVIVRTGMHVPEEYKVR